MPGPKDISIFAFMIAVTTGMSAMAQDLRCGTSSIRLICDRRDAQDNTCVASHAEFILENGQTKIVNTPKGLDASQIPVEVDCEKGNGGEYVFIMFSNGGGPGTAIDLFKPDGTAITKNGKLLDRTVKELNITPYSQPKTIELQ